MSADEKDPERFNEKALFRYVEVSNELGLRARYFYIKPLVKQGDRVTRCSILGVYQSLQKVFPGITDHYHFEVLKMVGNKKVFSDPEQFIEAVSLL